MGCRPCAASAPCATRVALGRLIMAAFKDLDWQHTRSAGQAVGLDELGDVHRRLLDAVTLHPSATRGQLGRLAGLSANEAALALRHLLAGGWLERYTTRAGVDGVPIPRWTVNTAEEAAELRREWARVAADAEAGDEDRRARARAESAARRERQQREPRPDGQCLTPRARTASPHVPVAS